MPPILRTVKSKRAERRKEAFADEHRSSVKLRSSEMPLIYHTEWFSGEDSAKGCAELCKVTMHAVLYISTYRW